MNIYCVTSGSLQAVLRADSTAQVVDVFVAMHGVPSNSVHAVIVG